MNKFLTSKPVEKLFELGFGHFQGKKRVTAKFKPLENLFQCKFWHFPRKKGRGLTKKKLFEEFLLTWNKAWKKFLKLVLSYKGNRFFSCGGFPQATLIVVFHCLLRCIRPPKSHSGTNNFVKKSVCTDWVKIFLKQKGSTILFLNHSGFKKNCNIFFYFYQVQTLRCGFLSRKTFF